MICHKSYINSHCDGRNEVCLSLTKGAEIMALLSFGNHWKFWGGLGLTSSLLFGFNCISDDYKPHIVIIGGGIMGSWSMYLLSQSINNRYNENMNRYPYRVSLIDAGHPIRGSWGDNRALHATFDCDLRLKSNKLNICDYLKLQKQSIEDGSDACLIKKVVDYSLDLHNV